MKLVDLNPSWVGAGGPGITRNGEPVPERHGIGVTFDCPCGCPLRVYVPFDRPLDGGPPYESDGRHLWERTGDTFDTLTLSPSILRVGGCGWHGWVKAGEVTPA